MATQQEVIKKFMASLDTTTLSGEKALDAAVKAASGGKFTTAQQVINQMISDCKNAGSADAFLKTYCGINLDNTDTGAITGADAGGSTVKTKESIVPESGSLKNFKGNSFTVNGLTFTLAEDFNSLSDKEKFIWKAMYTWWAKSALDLIEASYGLSFKNANTVNFKNVTVSFDYDLSTTWRAWNSWHANWQGDVTSVELVINMIYYPNLSETNPNGYSSGEELYLDKTIAHELTHSIMNAKIWKVYELPTFIKEGIAELTIGIDDERADDITALAKNSTLLQKNLQDNLKGKSVDYDYSAGYMFFRYLAKQASIPDNIGKNISNTKNKTTLTGSDYADTISNKGNNVTINALAGNDSIMSYGASNVTINAGDGNDSIDAYGSKTSINTGAGNDYVYLYTDAYNATVNATAGDGKNEIYSGAQTAVITAGAGDDYVMLYNNAAKQTVNAGGGKDEIYSGAQTASINAGTGNDYVHLYQEAAKHTVKAGTGDDTIRSYSTSGVLYQYALGDGNDSIVGSTAKDTISITGGNYSSVKNGSDLIITVGTGKITLVGAANLSTVNIKGKKEDSAKNISNAKNKMTLTGSDYADTISNKGNNVTINALAGNDSIMSYGASNVKINAGDGKDSVYAFGSKISINVGKSDDYIYLYSNAENSTVTATEGNNEIHSAAQTAVLTAGAGDDYIMLYNNATKQTVNAGGGKDEIYSGAQTASINAGAGNDYVHLYQEAAKHTVKAGTGDDTIKSYSTSGVLYQYALGDGNDSIVGSTAKDTISITGGNYSSVKSGSDVIITVGTGKITLVGGKGIIKGTSTPTPTSKTLTVTKNVTLGSAYQNADASKLTKAVKITGNSSANSIVGGSKNDTLNGAAGNDTLTGGKGNDKLYGGTGNDTLIGGAGNDSLWGDTGNDTFLYSNGDGKDVIFNFETGDLLQITGAFSASYNKSKKEIYFKVGTTSNAITLKNFDTSTFNVNGDSYKISGTKLVKK